MGGVVLLRTLTEKSKLGFGKYADLPIWKIIDMGEKRYLRFTYYTLSNINYTEDVLRKIDVVEQDEIFKPGKNKAKLKEVDKKIWDSLSDEERLSLYQKSKSISKNKWVKSSVSDRRHYSAKSNQLRNQGHIR
jgi:hypothetical protein